MINQQIGRLHYSPENPDGCKKYKDEWKPLQEQTLNPGSQYPFIFMVERGNCTFVTKARNIAHAGGAVALVINSKVNYSTKKTIIMSDDGTGAGIRIPSLMIDHDEGQKLLDFYTL